ncbi:MAG: magnesium transporter CorA family protein [Vallitaleaceae bacterium]|nr:magnesium transporter CorA family protein [Vallitaleaceae bacterium]
MISMYKTNETNAGFEVLQTDLFRSGAWINLIQPTEDEIKLVTGELKIPLDFIRSALDEEERARIETDDGFTMFLIDIPVISTEERTGLYGTIPMGIIIGEKHIITVCLQDNPIINDFIDGRVKAFFTFKKTRFLFQMLYRNSTYYLQYLRDIDKKSDKIEKELHRSMKNKELIQLLGLEKSLVYFSTSLKSNEAILEKIMRVKPVKMYLDDEEILEDVIIENKQAIEMANIYSTILSGTMDAFASVISNNLNIVMKFLASITIVLSIPTMVASFFGMNVGIPMGDNPYAFLIIFIMSFVISGVLGLVMFKKNLF